MFNDAFLAHVVEINVVAIERTSIHMRKITEYWKNYGAINNMAEVMKWKKNNTNQLVVLIIVVEESRWSTVMGTMTINYAFR